MVDGDRGVDTGFLRPRHALSCWVSLGKLALSIHLPHVLIVSRGYLTLLIGDATEQVSMSLGQTLGGLLNAT
jgi:Ca2+:H+ antiporter